MKKIYDKNPILYGILIGQGLSLIFVLFEYFLVATGISECGIIVDSCIRVGVGIIAIFFMKEIYGKQLPALFIAKMPKTTWLYCIPFFLCLAIEFLYVPISESLTTAFVGHFLLLCIQQLATGFWEEAASKGIVMSGMLLKWKNTVKGRIAMVFICGILFGTLHIFNFVFSNNIISCLWQALYSSAFGVFVAAIYLHSRNLTFCMMLHAVWDIVIRFHGNFCENVQGGAMLNFIYTSRDVLELVIFPIVAIVICVMWKEKENKVEVEEIAIEG